MIDIPVRESIIDHSKYLLEQGSFGNRGTFDGTPDQQLTGLIGENIVRLALGYPLMRHANGWDGGVDFTYGNVRVDVKTMGRQVPVRPDYVHNLVASQDYDVDAYVFCSLNKSSMILTICGAVTKREHRELAVLFKAGDVRTHGHDTFVNEADNYEIFNYDLVNFSDICGLIGWLQCQMQAKTYEKRAKQARFLA